MPAWVVPSVADFKAFFVRDFNYAAAGEQSNLSLIVDADISRAILEASGQFVPGLFPNNTAPNGFMYLAAWEMVENIRNSSKGLQSQSNFPISSKAAGPVNVTYQIPEKYMKDPYIASLASNGYGVKYLSMVLPYIKGNVRVANAWGGSWGRDCR